VIRLAVRVHREHAEAVLAELLELAPAGVEEADVGADVVEYAVYGSPGELPRLPELRAAAGKALVEVATSELPDDWGERWRSFHRPVLIEAPEDLPSLHVRPPWEPPSTREGALEIVIDPGQAFGTGAHATTRLCLALLLECTAERDRESPPADSGDGSRSTGTRGPGTRGPGTRGPLLDVGTGSGVLAIAAAHLGYAPVIALDNDPESVAAARANAEVNGVPLDVSRLDLRRDPMPVPTGAGAPTVLANLLRPLLLDLAHTISSPPADLIVGGLLAEQVDDVVGAFETRLHLSERERCTDGEWAAAWLAPDP
jgi:ribosomal protein L11 methyltransferase